MRKLFLSALLLTSLGFAQEETYQVLGFPPFAPAPQMLEVVEDKGDTVVVRHLMGETEIPKNPQRVYTDASTLEVLVSLGVVPVGANYQEVAGLPPALEDVLTETTLFERADINLEAILSLQPDVIIGWDMINLSGEGSVRYEQLSRIAPTVVLFENPFTFWQQATRDVAEVFDLSGQADEVLGTFEEQREGYCGRIRSVIGDETSSIVMVGARDVHLFGPGYETVNSDLPSDTGFIPLGTTVWAYSYCRLLPGPEVSRLVGTEGSANLSLEILPELQADHLAVLVNPDAASNYETVTEHPLWNAIPAVQNGKVYQFRFFSALGYYSSLWVLERVADTITSETN